MEKLIIWKTITFNFCLHQPRSREQSECTNVCRSKTRFLALKNLRSTRELYIYMDGCLQAGLKFHKNKHIVKSISLM